MRTILLAAAILALNSCDEVERKAEDAAQARGQYVAAKTANGHFLQVGTTPDGRPLMLTMVDVGYQVDRVYVVGNTVTAQEHCGKRCDKTIVTDATPVPASK